MLKHLRRIIAVLSLVAVTLLFVDFTGQAALHWAWLARIQLVPALLAVNALAVVFLLLATVVFGRIYCSVICPMGIFQDVIIRVRHWLAPVRKKRPWLYRYEKARRRWRVGFLALFAVLMILGLLGVVAASLGGILDPYSAYGRIAGQFFTPVWRAGAAPVLDVAADGGVYLADRYPAPYAFSLAVTAVAGLTAVLVVVMAWRTGRGYCNTVCPVGTLLGLVSRFSLLRPVIDTDKCNRCGSCGRKCKARCIDTKNHTIDYSRCIVCFDCLNNCSQGAISYRLRRRTPEHTTETTGAAEGRRAFLVGGTIMAGALALRAADKVTDGGLAPLKKKQPHKKASQTVPAGAISLAHLRSHCTACQLCISECPEGVLRPSSDPSSFMQPVMRFTDGYCRPECTRCSQICPAGAIQPVDTATKSATKIGTAVVDASACISAAYGQTCGNCSRHCPAGAIEMIKTENGNLRPVVDEARCIGCGACEYHCPVGTAGQLSAKCAAIHVEGVESHRNI
ncbi:MAG: 4Fe-4S binding protein [Muribaculaceae bacterium]|nr:4Fe-4S binding protein [Muribaculaceae bacterium]